MTIEQDAARIKETFAFFRFPGQLTVTHDNGLACLDVQTSEQIEAQNLWLSIASHRALDGNIAMRITINGKLYRICPSCNFLHEFESLEQEKCEDCLKPSSYYKPDPIKQKARQITYKAIRDGLVRGEPDACEDCGTTEQRLTIHHLDYSQPLEIEWLCTKCHGKRHRGNRRYYAFSSHVEARMAWI